MKSSIRDRLIPETLRNALSYEPYASTWNIPAGQDVGAIPLRQIPIIRREQFWPLHEELTARSDADIAVVSHSTGTGGWMAFRYLTVEDIATRREFIRETAAALPPCEPGPKPIALILTTVTHGTSHPNESTVFAIHGLIYPSWAMDQTIEVLRREYALPAHEHRISILIGPLSDVVRFTFALMKRGLCGDDFAVRRIRVYGGYVPSTVSTFLRRWWNADIEDVYSMSESVSAALPCEECAGRFHFYEPFVQPEFVDLRTHEPIESGQSMLLLTELFPFVRFFPLVRYWTRDVVEVHPPSCSYHLPSFRFVGREGGSLFDPADGRLLLGQAELNDAMSHVPQVRRHELPEIDLGGLTTPISPVHVSVTLESEGDWKVVCVIAQVTFAVDFYRDERARVEQIIREVLVAASPSLRAALDGHYRLSVTATNAPVAPHFFK